MFLYMSRQFKFDSVFNWMPVDLMLFTDGDRGVTGTGHNDRGDEVTGMDDTGTTHEDDARSVTSQDSDTEVFCDTSDLPLVCISRNEIFPACEHLHSHICCI